MFVLLLLVLSFFCVVRRWYLGGHCTRCVGIWGQGRLTGARRCADRLLFDQEIMNDEFLFLLSLS